MNYTPRIRTFDLVKLIAIFSVLWGHVVQYLCSGNFYENAVYQKIYSFHMPLFMMITGFFSVHSLQTPVITTMKKKFNQLIVPGITFAIVTCIIMKYTNWDSVHETFFYGLWFLKSAFLCYSVLILVSLVRKISKYAWVAIIIATLFISQLIFVYQFNLMYPCFILRIPDDIRSPFPVISVHTVDG